MLQKLSGGSVRINDAGKSCYGFVSQGESIVNCIQESAKRGTFLFICIFVELGIEVVKNVKVL